MHASENNSLGGVHVAGCNDLLRNCDSLRTWCGPEWCTDKKPPPPPPQQGFLPDGKTPYKCTADQKNTVGSLWCPKTCGTCGGVPATWLVPSGQPQASKPQDWHPRSEAAQDYSISGVDFHIYKNLNPLTGKPTTLQAIKDGLELHAGAHYYATGFMDKRFRGAKAVIRLPVSGTMDSLGKREPSDPRIPCFSLAVSGANGSTDFGVEWNQTRQGWFAFFYSSVTRTRTDGKLLFPLGTTRTVDTTINVSFGKLIIVNNVVTGRENDAVTATFVFRDAEKKVIGREPLTFSYKHYFDPIDTRNPNADCLAQFTRFISFLHSNGGNDALRDFADETKLWGQLDELQLLPRGGTAYIPWTRDLLSKAWASQLKNIITIDIAESKPATDTVQYKHTYWYL